MATNDTDQRRMERKCYCGHAATRELVLVAARGSLRIIKSPELIIECTHAP